jgi:hypothetical protein
MPRKRECLDRRAVTGLWERRSEEVLLESLSKKGFGHLRNGRGERIRTSDPLVPNQVRYQTALRPEQMLR